MTGIIDQRCQDLIRMIDDLYHLDAVINDACWVIANDHPFRRFFTAVDIDISGVNASS
jgi:hypothetical protein